MAQPLPQVYYACPCTDITASPPNPTHVSKAVHTANGEGDSPATTAQDTRGAGDEAEEQKTFNPHSPRANYVLYPLESLLFCNECHELRCPKCWYEEAAYYYCPNCLFETGASVVKNETNRCTRSCFQCPICIATLSVTSIRVGPRDEARAGVASSTADGPFILSCPQCSWTTLEAGLTFEKSINLHGQLTAKLKGNNSTLETARELSSALSTTTSPVKDGNVFEAALSVENQIPHNSTPSSLQDPDAEQFLRLASFYRTQIAETSAGAGGGSGGGGGLGFLASQQLGFDSPSTLSRLLSTYGVGAIKKQKGRVPQQREAMTATEGLYLDHPAGNPDEQPAATASKEQHLSSSSSSSSLSLPIATQLRVKRSKRCPTCRSPLAKPDDKRHSTRYRIKLLASSHVPCVSLKPYNPHPLHSTMNLEALPAGKPAQFLLKVRNPIFDPVRVSLATPQLTPSSGSSSSRSRRRGHRVTILCPTFDVGANTDVWDEALESSASAVVSAAAKPGAAGGGGGGGGDNSHAASGGGTAAVPVAEAGKVWEKGRNWTTVILELVPSAPDSLLKSGDKQRSHANDDYDDDDNECEEDDGEDAEAIQIPIHVRLEYETDDTHQGPVVTTNAGSSGGGGGGDSSSALARPKELVKTDSGRVQRELAFWVVLVAGHTEPSPSSSA